MKTLFAMVMAVLTFPGLAWAQAWNHSPDSAIGPLHWGTVTPSYATCGDSKTGEVGMKQSPIDIVPDNALAASFSALLFKYNATPLKIENTGHYVEVPYDLTPSSYLYVGSQPTDVYQLVQFHFHAPSEHTINGIRYDAELHLVHTNAIGEPPSSACFCRVPQQGCRYSIPSWPTLPHRLEKLNCQRRSTSSICCRSARGFIATPDHSRRRRARKACNGSLCKIRFPSRPTPSLNCIP